MDTQRVEAEDRRPSGGCDSSEGIEQTPGLVHDNVGSVTTRCGAFTKTFRPYGNLDWKPMSPNTKSKIKKLRVIQLILRIFTLIGAMGLLACVIFIKPTGDGSDWIIRVPVSPRVPP